MQGSGTGSYGIMWLLCTTLFSESAWSFLFFFNIVGLTGSQFWWADPDSRESDSLQWVVLGDPRGGPPITEVKRKELSPDLETAGVHMV